MLARFRGTLIGLFVLVLVAAVVLLRPTGEPEAALELPRIFRFEKEDMVGVRIERSDQTIALSQDDAGEWRFDDRDWRPSRSMVRRIAHQLHDLSARAEVVQQPEAPERYGLGNGAIRVSVHLRDGSTIAFEAGDPNPTSVSWYMRTLPNGPVFVVKKAALDYYRSELEEFREDKFAFFDASDAVAVEAEVDGRQLTVERTGPKSWRMTEPVEQDASRDEVRMMLGRVSALKAFGFVRDHPTELAHLGLEPPQHRIRVRLASGESITLALGHAIEGTEPPQRYVYRAEDDAVYAARDGLLEAYRKPVEDYRNRVLIGKQEWDVVSYEATLGDDTIPIQRTADDWRWPDGAVVQGSTDKRVAGRAADLRAVGFRAIEADAAGLERPWGRVALVFEDASTVEIRLGDPFDVPGEEGRTEERQYAQVGDDPTVFEVDGRLADVIEDLHREYGRKQQRDAEKNLDGAEIPAEP